jgi:hypothetical protein
MDHAFLESWIAASLMRKKTNEQKLHAQQDHTFPEAYCTLSSTFLDTIVIANATFSDFR